MGVLALDDVQCEWTQTIATITHVEGNVIYLDRHLIGDYCTEQNGTISNTFSPLVFFGVQSARVEGLCVEGNRAANRLINGCIGAGIFLLKSRVCQVEHCLVRNFEGDGLVTAITQDITVEGCTFTGMRGLGLHFGAGSAHAVARGNTCTRTRTSASSSVGAFSTATSRAITSPRTVSASPSGTRTLTTSFSRTPSAGTAPTACCSVGKVSNAGSRNRFVRNRIEDNTGCGVWIRPDTTDLTFEENVIRDTRAGDARTQRVGLSAEAGAARIKAVGNEFANHVDGDVNGEIEVG